MYETRTSEHMDPLALGSRILTRLIVLYVMGFNTSSSTAGFRCAEVSCSARISTAH